MQPKYSLLWLKYEPEGLRHHTNTTHKTRLRNNQKKWRFDEHKRGHQSLQAKIATYIDSLIYSFETNCRQDRIYWLVFDLIFGNWPRSPKPTLRSASPLAQKSCVSGYALHLIDRNDAYMMEFSIPIHFLEGNPLTTEMWVTRRMVINLTHLVAFHPEQRRETVSITGREQSVGNRSNKIFGSISNRFRRPELGKLRQELQNIQQHEFGRVTSSNET